MNLTFVIFQKIRVKIRYFNNQNHLQNLIKKQQMPLIDLYQSS